MLLYCQSAHTVAYSCIWPTDWKFHFLFVFKWSATATPITCILFIFTFCGVCRVGGNPLSGDALSEEDFAALLEISS